VSFEFLLAVRKEIMNVVKLAGSGKQPAEFLEMKVEIRLFDVI
jgi:hypothetical protein